MAKKKKKKAEPIRKTFIQTQKEYMEDSINLLKDILKELKRKP